MALRSVSLLKASRTAVCLFQRTTTTSSAGPPSLPTTTPPPPPPPPPGISFLRPQNRGLLQVRITHQYQTQKSTSGSSSSMSTLPRNEKGEFVRPETAFRNWVTVDGSSGFVPEAGRYHLYVSYACPFAARALIGRAVKGLESAISVTVTDPHLELGGKGWKFWDQDPDTLNGKTTLREIYQLAESDYNGRVSVPVLWDTKQRTIVNNESAEILRMIGTGVFDEFCATPEQKTLDLYPEHLRKEIDEMNEFVYPNINNGVYKAGFAASQEAYDTAANELFGALDKIEEILSKQRYLVGNTLTEADIRLVTTLFRFDMVYHQLFKCNKRMLMQYPNIWGFTRDIYQTPGVASTVNLSHINTHYWWSLNNVNPTRVVPLGPEINFSEPHDRDRFGK